MGTHPLVLRVCKGAFTKRPPPRKVPLVWDPTPVLDIFMYWTLPLSCAQLMRKCAFILAILSGRRLSELFGLRCDDKHI
jgi:integrase